MITPDQIKDLSKKYKINETVVVREYYQLLFLSKLYSKTGSEKIFFKGGTAIHLLFGAKRFSEDLDFTAVLPEKDFNSFLKRIFQSMEKEEEVSFKTRKTITGKRFLMTAKPSAIAFEIFINLDFSFREKILNPKKSTITTEYPVLFTSFIYHPSKEEILAEKIRALVTRTKGRDLYDLWFLVSQKVNFNNKLINKKLKYYGIENMDKKEILKKASEISSKEFILDLRPFIPINERDRLAEFYEYILESLKDNL